MTVIVFRVYHASNVPIRGLFLVRVLSSRSASFALGLACRCSCRNSSSLLSSDYLHNLNNNTTHLAIEESHSTRVRLRYNPVSTAWPGAPHVTHPLRHPHAASSQLHLSHIEEIRSSTVPPSLPSHLYHNSSFFLSPLSESLVTSHSCHLLAPARTLSFVLSSSIVISCTRHSLTT